MIIIYSVIIIIIGVLGTHELKEGTNDIKKIIRWLQMKNLDYKIENGCIEIEGNKKIKVYILNGGICSNTLKEIKKTVKKSKMDAIKIKLERKKNELENDD